MNLTHDGLTVWFGTSDAPGPFDAQGVARVGVSLVIGAHPANPTNSVLVRYRVDRGIEQSEPGRQLRTDLARDTQYFLVVFPEFVSGTLVEYWPLLCCGGRQVPAPHGAHRFRGSFRLAEALRGGLSEPRGPRRRWS